VDGRPSRELPASRPRHRPGRGRLRRGDGGEHSGPPRLFLPRSGTRSGVPPRLAQALYKAAARIPGITVVDDAVDALGRHGIAIARTDAGQRTEWIFNRNTLQFLGERTVAAEASPNWGPAGTVLDSTAIVARSIVDRPGQLPA